MSALFYRCNFRFKLISVIFFNVTCCEIILISNKVPGNVEIPIYWNIPTFQCASHKIYFADLANKYGIIQNENDKFRGEKIAILYDPGAFPAILHGKDSKKEILRNGGIPQKGNLSFHLDLFKEHVENLIPNRNFNGLGVIDFESWRPIFRQNFGTLTPYKELSIKEVRKIHPLWPANVIEREAARFFEFGAEIFMRETLLHAKRLRPYATWGYYHYPYCFNMSPSNRKTNCPPQVTAENNKINLWLFENTDDLHPSIYVSDKNMTTSDRVRMVIGRIKESQRIITRKKSTEPTKTYPYFWYKYQDTKKFIKKEGIYEILKTLTTLRIDGLVLWGSSNDVNSKKNCEDLYKYIEFVLGPALLALMN